MRDETVPAGPPEPCLQKNQQRRKRGKPANEEKDELKQSTHTLSSNLSIIIFQSLIQLPGCFAIRKAIMCDFIEAALFEVISYFAAINAVFRGIHAEN